MRSEDDRALIHLFDHRGAVGAVEGRYAERRQFIHGEAVVNDQSDDIDRSRNSGILRRLARQLHCVNHAVAIATWSDLDDVHMNNSAFHLWRNMLSGRGTVQIPASRINASAAARSSVRSRASYPSTVSSFVSRSII